MIKSTGIIRKIDMLGRIVIPAQARQFLSIEQNDDIEIMIDEDNEQIILQKSINTCLKCKSSLNLKEIKCGYYICRHCIEELK